MNMRINWEALGVAASVACAIHCALMPLIITSLPLLGASILSSLWLELLMLGTAFLIGASTLWHGFRRHHHKKFPLVLFSLGMLLFTAHLFIKFKYSVWAFIVPGIAFILTAHFLNHRYCRLAKHCHSTDCNH